MEGFPWAAAVAVCERIVLDEAELRRALAAGATSAEGLARLVKVRRRQDRGSRELSEAYPEMLANESKPAMRWADYVRLFLGQPICFVVYVFVVLVVRCGPDRDGRAWSRGR